MNNRWVQLVLGIWILVSPWVLGFSGAAFATWSNVGAGLVLILVNIWELFGKGEESGGSK